jgi:hypothetical protein
MHKGLRAFIPFLAVLALTILAITSPAEAGDWKGKVETIEGKRVVSNPAAPMKEATTIDMERLWRLGGFSDDEDEFFGVIGDIEIDEAGDVYLLDSQLAEVKIYDDDGNFINAIGREGEGPGEFRRPSAMFLTSDGKVAILQTVPGKIVLLTKEGDPAGEMPLPQPDDGGFQILLGVGARSDNLVLHLARNAFDQETNKWSRKDFLASVDDQGVELAEYASRTKTINMAAPVLSDADWDTFENRWTIGPDGKVYGCESFDDYVITVWNKDGSVDKKITREYKHRPRSADEKDFLNNIYGGYSKRIPGETKISIKENCKDIDGIHVRDDGTIWVLSSNGARDLGDDVIGTFDVYNKDGQFVRNVTLNGEGDANDDRYLFVRDRFYVVTKFWQATFTADGVEGVYEEDEDAEPMAVISYKLEADVLAAR